MENIIELKNICVRYLSNEENSLSDISLSIKKGEVISIVGKSGSGKTTFCNLLNGIIPNFIDAEITGDYYYNGEYIKKFDFLEIGKNIGTVFQHPKLQFFTTKVFSELAFPSENYNISVEVIEKRINEILNSFRINEKYNDNLDILSAGQQQAVAISSIYVLNPDVYIMDEPTANLDKENINNLISFIELMKKSGKTIIISDHRIACIMGVVDRFIYLEKGKIKYNFTNGELRNLPDEKRKFLGLRNLNCSEINIKEIKYDERYNITFEDIYFKLKKENRIIINIEKLYLKENSCIGILGENGIGKSTLMKCLYGIKGYNSKFILDGKELSKKEVRNNSYIVFQNSTRQLFKETVYEEILSCSDSISENEAIELLNKIGLKDYLKRHPLTLSGGERQRLTILLALIQKRNYIYLDEPTSGLDFQNMELVSNLIKTNIPKDGFIFVISHDVEFLNLTCDYIIDANKILKW